MPYKDKQKNNEVSIASAKRLYYPAVRVVFRKAEPEVYAALNNASANEHMTKTEYLRLATIEKLIRDGYLSPDHDNTPE